MQSTAILQHGSCGNPAWRFPSDLGLPVRFGGSGFALAAMKSDRLTPVLLARNRSHMRLAFATISRLQKMFAGEAPKWKQGPGDSSCAEGCREWGTASSPNEPRRN